MSSGEKLDGVNCKLANKEASKIRKLDTTYQQNLKMMDEIKPVLKQLFKMTDNQLKNMVFSSKSISGIREGAVQNHDNSEKRNIHIYAEVLNESTIQG